MSVADLSLSFGRLYRGLREESGLEILNSGLLRTLLSFALGEDVGRIQSLCWE